MQAVSLDLVHGDPFQLVMRSFHAFALLCLACCSLDAGEPDNPLAGSLRDPWGIVSKVKKGKYTKDTSPNSAARSSPASSLLSTPTETSMFDPSFKAFQSQHATYLDISSFDNPEDDSLASRYDRGAREWDAFKPTDTVFPSGIIFYGDPSTLASNLSHPVTTTAATQWSLLIKYAIAFTSLLLLGICCVLRFQVKCTPDHKTQ